MIARFLIVLFAVAAFALSAASPRAQTTDEAARLDAMRQEIERIEASLARPGLTDSDLQRTRADIDSAQATIQSVEQSLAPRLDAAKARLDQLGPAPDPKVRAEGAAAAADREEQTRLFNALDAAIKRARVLSVQADQARDDITAKRRTLFADSLLKRSPSLLSPALWRSVVVDMPRDVRALATLSEDWLSFVTQRARGWDVALLVIYVLGVALTFRPLRRLVMRLIDRSRRGDEPSDLHKVALGLWTAFVMSALPLAAIVGALALLDAFGLASPRFSPALTAAGDGVGRVVTVAGLGWGLLAPKEPRWRVFDISDAVAERILSLLIQIAVVVSLLKFVIALLDASAAAPLTIVAVRGVWILAIVALLWRGLVAIARSREATADDHLAALRALLWLAAIVVALAAISGYVALAGFLVDQVGWILGVGSVAYALTKVAGEGADALLSPESRLGRLLASSVGLRTESLAQIGVIASGATTLAIIVGALMLAAAPWGIESQDVFGYLRAAYFGVKVGDVTLSLSSIAGGAAIFLALLLATRGIQRWLDSRFLPSTHLDPGLRNAIRTSFGYVGFVIAASVALAHVGLGLDKIAIVAGALSVGIGFGLQSIVSNFVSGLILLWERAIRVGDWIVVGDEQGFVRRINVRSTEIETFDRALVVMPNTNLVTGVVKNWVRGDRVGRVKLAVGVSYEADPAGVREILITAAKAHESVLKIPAPSVLFTSFGDSALMFELVCFVEDVETAGRVKSDLHFAIFEAFRDARIEIPFPQRDMNLRGTEALVAALEKRAERGE